MTTIEAEEYSLNQEIVQFFLKTSAVRSECDALAVSLVGGVATPVAVQGVCSYTVYAGPSDEFVVQFRLKSLQLPLETAALAKTIFGEFAPDVAFKGQIGDDSGTDGKEPLYVYVMTRMRGISQLDFILAHSEPENSPEWFQWRNNFITDLARFFARAWKSPQTVDAESRDKLRVSYEKDMGLLLASLPERFRPVIQQTIDSIPAILNLPMVLLHKDFGSCNIIVDSASCHLVGVIDWAEAQVGPFGLNLYSLQSFMSKLHLRNGWIRYKDYDSLQSAFWAKLQTEVPDMTDEQIETAKAARILGQLLSRGFTSRLANMPEPVPIKDDKSGAYNMMILDGLLVNPVTRIV
ncbi:hypothetical protein QBC40DRAFT_203108 [Triangularia verruculosa]|uniref:Aminoglycoside phosphotransferase domain-containing protein n=1 Tax=Triangularia verruculosa TaxID=2587418 RepID=A0AAN7AUN6_9PEZI|nr:hypothetical protein QBC40DRAFT_203108 [Triangularia verruculosa]